MSAEDNKTEVDWDSLIEKAQKMFEVCASYGMDEDRLIRDRSEVMKTAANMLNAIANADRRREEALDPKKSSVKLV